MEKSLKTTPTSTSGEQRSSVVLGFDEPIPFEDLSKGSRKSTTQQRAWQKLVQAVAKTDGAPDIQRLQPGAGGQIDLGTLSPGQAAWVTPHRGPAAGRHVLVAKRPNGDFVLLGGMNSPNTRIDDKSGDEYLVDDQGKDIADQYGKPRKVTPEDYLSHVSKRHFAFKQREKPTTESEEEKERKKEYAVFAEKKRAAQSEFKVATKEAKVLVKTHKEKLRETLGLAEGTTLTKESEGAIAESFKEAALGLLQKKKVPVDKETEQMINEFAKRATQSFKRERNKKIEKIQEVLLSAAKKGRNGKSTADEVNRLKKIARKIKVGMSPAEEPFMQSLQDMQDGDMFSADNNLDLAANQMVTTAFDHADQQATEESLLPDDDEAHGDDASLGASQDLIDLLHAEEAPLIDTGLNLTKTISKFKSEDKHRRDRDKMIKQKTMVPQFSQVDAEPEFKSEIERRDFFDKVATDQRLFAAARVVADRAKDKIKEISEEAAAQGFEERPRTAVSPEELATSFQDVETAMASTGVSPEDIKKEMKLLETAQNTTSPNGPGMYTVINEFWNDKSGNLLDSHMRRGSEYALSGIMAEHLPPEILATEEVQGLLGKLATRVKFNPRTQRFEMMGAMGGATQAQYGGLVQRTSASVAPVIVSRRLAQLAQRGETERNRIKEIEKILKHPEGLKRTEKRLLTQELSKLSESPFGKHFGHKDFDRMIQSVDDWNRNNILKVEDEAMREDREISNRIEQEEKQFKTGEQLRPEDKIGVVDINPRSKLARVLERTESVDALRRRRQENLGVALGSLQTVATLNVALREASAKAQWRAAKVSRIPEEGEAGEKFKYVTSPNVPSENDVRIDIPGAVDDPDPEKRDLVRNTTKISAYDYVRNQLGIADSEIHEVEGSAMAVPKGKLAVIGIDKNGAHVRVKLGGPTTQEEVEALTAGKKKKARGLLDKIPRGVAAKQASSDRFADIRSNQELPTREDHPPLIRETMRSDPSKPMELRLGQFNAFRFMKEPKLFDDSGKPIRGSKGGLNTMVMGAGKTASALASIADNHRNNDHMNYIISVPPGMVQQWGNEANEMTNFHVVGILPKAEKGNRPPAIKKGEFITSLETALAAQKSEKHPTPIMVSVPNGSEMAKGYGVNGWGKEDQHVFFKKMYDIIKNSGSVEGRNIIFVMQHDVDSNIHSQLTKRQAEKWGKNYAQEYGAGNKEKDVIDHLKRLGVRGRIVDEPQMLLSSGETSNRSAAGKRILKSPMEYRQLLTGTPARRQLSEAFDAVQWVAKTPKMVGNEYVRNDKGHVQYHPIPGLPGSGDAFMASMGGLGRGTFTHEHIMQKQAQQMFANWNIGDEKIERNYRQTTHNHDVTRTPSQVERQIEIEKNTRGVVEREIAEDAKREKMTPQQFRDKRKEMTSNSVSRALQYAKAEHHQNITGTGVVREGKEIVRRTKDEMGGVKRLPRTNPADWKHNAKINAMVDQVQKSVKKNPDHKIVVVADNPDQVAAIKIALETVYKPIMGIDPVTGKKTGRMVSPVSTLGRITMGKTKQEGKATSPAEIEQRKADFEEGKIKALIIDQDSAQGHNLQTADSIHMMSYFGGEASTVAQAQARSDRPRRPVRSDKEVTKEILGVVRREGIPSIKVRIAIRDALNEANQEYPDKFPKNMDVNKLSDKEVGNLLSSYRKYNENKWKRLALKVGVFTESPLEVHSYHMKDAPQELQEYDLIRRGVKNNEVTTPALKTEPYAEERVVHAPSGKEESRVKTKSLYLRHDLVKAKSNPPLIVRV